MTNSGNFSDAESTYSAARIEIRPSFQFFACNTPTLVVVLHTAIGDDMGNPKLSRLELQIMDALWCRENASIREIQESFPEKHRPAYTTIQTMVYRLETKKAVRRVKKVGNFHVFEAAISRDV